MVELVSASLRWVGTVRNPINYFVLLRHLFRGIGGGKFEVLYKVCARARGHLSTFSYFAMVAHFLLDATIVIRANSPH